MKTLRQLLILVCASLLSSQTLLAQYSEQGPKLVGSPRDSGQGESVALSSDGNTAIVGGWTTAWVWIRTGAVWSQQSVLIGSGAVPSVLSRISVDISDDGNTAIVGNLSDNNNVGAAWVWTRSGGVWTQQGAKLVGSGAAGNGGQGASVSLSADGNTAIVGGLYDNALAGAAWVWTRSGGVWTQQGPKLVGSGAAGIAQQGNSVALAGDGNTAVVGGLSDNSGVGANWVWVRNGGVWSQQGTKLVGSGATANAHHGVSVSLAADGNTMISGGLGDGAAWVWTRGGGVWTESGKLFNGLQGASVSLSADGNTAVIGAPYTGQVVIGNLFTATGAAWVWTRTGGVWTSVSKLVGSNGLGALQGSSVAISGDGNTVIVGGQEDSGGRGAAWVFVAAAVLAIPALSEVTAIILVLSIAALALVRLR